MSRVQYLVLFVCAVGAACSSRPSPTRYLDPSNKTVVAKSAVIRYHMRQLGAPQDLVPEKVTWSLTMLGKAQPPTFVGASWVHVGAADSAEIDVTPIGATPPGQPFIITATVGSPPVDYKSELVIQ